MSEQITDRKEKYMERKKFLKSYISSSHYAKKGGKTSSVIEGTAFSINSTSSIYISKNNIMDKVVGAVSILSDKTVKALATSKEPTCALFCGKDADTGLAAYLGLFIQGSVPVNMIYYDGHEFSGVNLTSKDLYKLILAIDRKEKPGDEIDEFYQRLDTSGFIDTQQSREIYILNDALRVWAVEHLVGKEFNILDLENDAEQIETWISGMENNFTAFLYGEETTTENDTDVANPLYDEFPSILNKAMEVLKNLPKIKPQELQSEPSEFVDYVGMSTKDKKKLIKKYQKQDFSLFSEKELLAMPESMQVDAQIARLCFEQNKEFLTLEDWENIIGIYNGDIRRFGMLGDTGVGKTTACRIYAGALNAPFYVESGSGGMEETDLLGATQLVTDEYQNNVTQYAFAPLANYVKYGGLYLFDEINGAPASILMKLNPLLDDTRYIKLLNNEVLRANDKFIFAEAMNIGAGYHGTGEMNLSHFDRMDEMYQITSKSIEEEAAIVLAKTNYTNSATVKKMCEVKAMINERIKEEGTSDKQACSIRRIIAWLTKAKRTNEFLHSSVSTVLVHLAVNEPADSKATFEYYLGHDDPVVQEAANEIRNIFAGMRY